MPFTPLHMGSGIAVKAVLRRKFSLMVFGWSQIIMDIQPLLVMITDKGDLHGFSHTYLGATIIGLFSGLSGKYLGEFGLRLIHEEKQLPINWKISFISAFIGTYSHVFIDSIMHSDIVPFSPISALSPFYGLVSIDDLHMICIASAIIGGSIYFLMGYLSKRKT